MPSSKEIWDSQPNSSFALVQSKQKAVLLLGFDKSCSISKDFPEPSIEEVYPESLTDGDVSRGELRGYSKILFDAVSFLRRNKAVGRGDAPPPLEFLTPAQSVQVIRNMEEIRKYLQASYAREHNGRDPFATPRSYPTGISFLDKEKEHPILFPIEPDEHEPGMQAPS